VTNDLALPSVLAPEGLDDLIDGPGLYFLFLRKGSSLQGFVAGQDGLVYIGLSEKLAERCHAAYEISSPSTLRRSIGAILREAKIINAEVLPRPFSAQAKPRTKRKAIQNFRFLPEAEVQLSKWITENIQSCFRPMQIPLTKLKELEKRYIKHWSPVLNIQHCSNCQRAQLEVLRAKCRAVAQGVVGQAN
jgi:hypothetical protein